MTAAILLCAYLPLLLLLAVIVRAASRRRVW